MLNLRYYQEEAIQSILNNLSKKRMMITMATGSGKTAVATSLISRLCSTGNVLFLVDRDLLRVQTLRTLINNRSLFGDKKIGTCLNTCNIVVETSQKVLRSNLNSIKDKFKYIVIDECHRGYGSIEAPTELQFGRIITTFRKSNIIGLTATPTINAYRIFGDPVYKYGYAKAVKDGYLSSYKYPKVYTIKTGNQTLSGISKLMKTPTFINICCSKLKESLTNDNKSVLIFAETKQHALQIQETMIRYGIDSVNSVFGDSKDRNEILKSFEDGSLRFLISVDLLTTGVDIPRIDTLVFMRSIKSPSLYDQMIGRATRLFGDKVFEIIDFADTYKNMLTKAHECDTMVIDSIHEKKVDITRVILQRQKELGIKIANMTDVERREYENKKKTAKPKVRTILRRTFRSDN